MRKGNWIYFAACLFCVPLGGMLALAGCDRAAQKTSARPAPSVSVVTMAPREVSLSTELSGRTSAYEIAEIRPRVNGIIEDRLFTEGAAVRQGDVLYRIDPAALQAEFDNAVAALAEARANLPAIRLRAERYRRLLADGAISRQEDDDATAAFDQLNANIAALQARVKSAGINLKYTQVTAPISGRIGKSNVTRGAIVTAYQSTPLATIQQLDPIYVDVPQSTSELLRMKARFRKGLLDSPGDAAGKVRLILEDGAAYPREGTLEFSDVTVDPSTASVTLRLLFPNPDGEILPGMFVRAMIREGMNPKAILVPQEGVSRDVKGDPYALIADEEDKVALRPLVLDRVVGNDWLVASGLVPGDRVIVKGVQGLRPGMPVTVTACGRPGTAQTEGLVLAALPAADRKEGR